MAKLPSADIARQTLKAIWTAWEAEAEEHQRAYLGASILGKKCWRELWYGFRWALDAEKHEGRMLRLFDTGHKEEARFISELRKAGITVFEYDEDTGEQFAVQALGGHFGGHLDGIVVGLPESKEPHEAEFKTHSLKSFEKLLAEGLRRSKLEHFVQMQMYMGLMGLERGFYLAKCKNTDDLYAERIRFEQKVFDENMVKAETIVFSPVPLPRASENIDYPPCAWCHFKHLCLTKTVLPILNCRTCIHSEPSPDGGWQCTKFNAVLDLETQRAGCPAHLWIPELLPFGKPVDQGPDFIVYPNLKMNVQGGIIK
jgi:hypothetical protein